MNKSNYIRTILFFLPILFAGVSANFSNIYAQTALSVNPTEKDSVGVSADSLFYRNKGINKTGLDSTIHSTATDTISLDLKRKTMRYRGSAKVDYTPYELEAEIITIDFKHDEMEAYGVLDSGNVPVGFPIMKEKGQAYAGEKIRFNLRTQKGKISLGETHLDEGFYFGSKIKRVSKNEMYIQDGFYTTCDNPEPHYHFGAKKMKFSTRDKVFVEPVTFYVEDMPLLTIPFGLFFPMQSGRRSGIIVPSFFFSKSRGVVFKDLGVYWAASDYWDTQFRTDLFSKGGIMMKSRTRWELRDVFSGYADLQYGYTRTDVDDPFNKNWGIELKHDHTISPQERLTVNLDFKTQGFNRKTYSGNYANSIEDWIKQTVTSNASFSKNFNNGHSLSLSYGRDQNIRTDAYTQTSRASYNVPNFKPLGSIKALPRWMRDIQTGLRTSLLYNNQKDLAFDEYTLSDTSYIDTSFVLDDQSRLELRPSFSVSPKLGHFTVTPSIGYSSNIYRRSLTKEYSPEDSALVESYEQGAFYEHRYSFSTGVSTKLFGIVDNRRPFLFFIKPEMLGFTAFRHTYNPSVNFRWTPDQSDDDNYFGQYRDRYGEMQRYSRFEGDGGGLASRSESFSLGYNDKHVFELKAPHSVGDSIEQKNYELLTLNFGADYNFAADSMNMSDIRLGFRTPAIKFLQFSGNARFTPYDEDIIEKENIYTGEIDRTYGKVNRYLASAGKGIARMTYLSMSVSTSFSSDGISFQNENEIVDTKDTSDREEQEPVLGSRFTARYQEKEDVDYFAENSPGYSPFNLPWNASFGLTYSYNKPTQDPESLRKTLYLTTNFSCTFAETWKISANTGYDFIGNEFRTPSLNLHKDLHCWDLQFNWTPFGDYSGFYLRFGIKASQLKDLKIEKQNSPLLR